MSTGRARAPSNGAMSRIRVGLQPVDTLAQPDLLLPNMTRLRSLATNGILSFFFFFEIQARVQLSGASVEVVIHGKRHLNLLNFGEHYEVDAPRLLIRFFPVPSMDWVGNVRIKCKDTNLEAELCCKGNSFLGLGGSSRFIKGKIFDSLSMETIYDIEGHWDRYDILVYFHF